jgi:hypothetical protein
MIRLGRELVACCSAAAFRVAMGGQAELGIKTLDFTALKHFRLVVMEEVSDGERSCDGVARKQIVLEVMEQDCWVIPAMIVIGNHVFWASKRGGWGWISQKARGSRSPVGSAEWRTAVRVFGPLGRMGWY